jgi:uncharacterized protein
MNEVTARRGVLRGDEGLRAGWSLLLFVALVAALVAGITVAIHHFHPIAPPPKGTPGAWWMALLSDGGIFAVLAVSAFLVSLVERRPFGRYGLRRTRWLPDLLAGMVWGLVMLSLLVGALAVTGALRFDGVLLSGGDALGFGVKWLAAFMAVGFAEEFMTRGFLQYTVARGVAGMIEAIAPRSRHARTIGFWVAAAIFSVGVFAAGHIGNSGESALGLLSVAIAGVTFVYVLYRTGSLWWAIGFHGTWDWAQSYLYGTHDSGLAVAGHLLASHPVGGPILSGGDTGPEGSILLIPTMLLTILVIRTTLPRRPTAFDAPGQPATDARPA